jgi:hypothetical protein
VVLEILKTNFFNCSSVNTYYFLQDLLKADNAVKKEFPKAAENYVYKEICKKLLSTVAFRNPFIWVLASFRNCFMTAALANF